MLDTITKFLSGVNVTIPFDIFGVVVIMLCVLFGYLFIKAHEANKLDWTDLLTSKGNKVSLTKFLQLVGGVTATWIMVVMTMKDKLTYDLLLIYLTYVGAIEAWSKFVAAKYGIKESPGTPGGEDKPEPK